MNQVRSCDKCFKYYNPVVIENCSFCDDYMFHENILCDLTRFVQDQNEIECFAFKVHLSLVGKNNEFYEIVSNNDNDQKLLERDKWLKAYSLQQLKSDPDQIVGNLNYHVCLTTVSRKKLFENIGSKLIETTSIFYNVGDRFDSEVNLLYAGHDHIHFHIKSSFDYSVDEVINEVAMNLNAAIKKEFVGLFKNRNKIFEKSYFSETIG